MIFSVDFTNELERQWESFLKEGHEAQSKCISRILEEMEQKPKCECLSEYYSIHTDLRKCWEKWRNSILKQNIARDKFIGWLRREIAQIAKIETNDTSIDWAPGYDYFDILKSTNLMSQNDKNNTIVTETNNVIGLQSLLLPDVSETLVNCQLNITNDIHADVPTIYNVSKESEQRISRSRAKEITSNLGHSNNTSSPIVANVDRPTKKRMPTINKFINRKNRNIRNSFLNKKYSCKNCEFSTTNRSSLKCHVNTVHLTIKELYCDKCDYSTSLKFDLKCHVNQVHFKNNINYFCDSCDFSTNGRSNLKIHVNAVHLRIKNFLCNKCDFSSYHKQGLKNHEKAVHLKIKEFSCDECDHSSSRKRDLKSHVKVVHHKIKDFLCDMCVYSASTKFNLNYHVKHVHLKNISNKCGYGDKHVM